jgi:hypothetical protein
MGQLFHDFPNLRAGDLVYIETRTATYTYQLRNGGRDVEVDASASWPLWPVPSPIGAGKKARAAAPNPDHLRRLPRHRGPQRRARRSDRRHAVAAGSQGPGW